MSIDVTEPIVYKFKVGDRVARSPYNRYGARGTIIAVYSACEGGGVLQERFDVKWEGQSEPLRGYLTLARI